ncbi:MAG TPA: hypothetical protein VEX86_10670 [Longimicrobium sp.]|nr:hypothetical protein [Longimicrobium sp.]
MVIASPVRVRDCLASMVWVKTAPEGQRHRPRPRFSFLAREPEYGDAFASLEGRKGVPLGLAVPWSAGDRFWDLYTARPPGSSRAEVAWRRGLPMLRHAPVKLAGPGGGYATTALYIYPHGLGLVLQVRLRGNLTLAETATAARDLRYDRQVLNGRSLPPDLLASSVLDAVGREVWGDETPLAGGGGEPFAVFTVVQATGADPKAAVEEGGEVHRFLDKVTGWYDRDRDPDPLESCRISSPRRDGHLLYGRRRSRCVWFPEHFDVPVPGEVRHSLSHYHRNLTCASLQTESLGQYACRADDDLRAPGYLSIPQRAYVRHVIGSIDRLNAGRPEDTYRSRSPARQLTDNGVIDSVERVRKYLERVL